MSLECNGTFLSYPEDTIPDAAGNELRKQWREPKQLRALKPKLKDAKMDLLRESEELDDNSVWRSCIIVIWSILNVKIFVSAALRVL